MAYVAGAYEKITVAATPIGITAALLNPTGGNFAGKKAYKAMLSVETDKISFTLDGSTPSATNGHQLSVGDFYLLTRASDLAALRMVKVTTNAAVKVTLWYRA